jgi:CRISPR/Cas system-associated exonuclease Cas4 (RecB family)
MGRELVNGFSWSKSRHEKLSECLRGYYFHYYGSWGGWAEDGPEEARRLYVLKKLGNRFTWAGSVAHDAIKSILLGIRRGAEVDSAALVEKVHRAMQADWKHSASKAYWRTRRRDFGGLVEHEYDEAVPKEEWEANWQIVRSAIEWFLSSRWVPLARSLKANQWLEVDDKSFEDTAFVLDGVKVFAIPDFAYVDGDGNPVVVDWKTGQAREGYDEQVIGYALYLSQRYQLRLDRMQAALVYLNDGVERLVRIDEDSVCGFKAHFARSVSRMKELLEDPERNVPRNVAAFPLTDDLETCARCAFRRACGRAGTATLPAASAE